MRSSGQVGKCKLRDMWAMVHKGDRGHATEHAEVSGASLCLSVHGRVGRWVGGF